MHDRPQSGENTVLVHVTRGLGSVSATSSSGSAAVVSVPNVSVSKSPVQEDIAEFQSLAQSAGAKILATIVANGRHPNARYFIGSGKAEEIRAAVAAHKAELVLINHELSPSQERNLEQLIGCRVIDRTELILDIFAQRARTFEGKLQVELAQLQHLATRLVRGWTHLERQKGGIGLRGPGETQLETDRRLVRGRIQMLEKRLEKVRMQRDQSRRARKQAAVPTVSLVGYTNAGKSTLFNYLARAETYVANQLFATLDPTLRRVVLRGRQAIVLADTVGFIRDLPHDLVAAFSATLLETQEASLLLHVIDLHDPLCQEHIREVNQVLKTIGADKVPQLEVYNKIDLVAGTEPRVEYNAEGVPVKCWLSGHTGVGIDVLKKALADIFYMED